MVTSNKDVHLSQAFQSSDVEAKKCIRREGDRAYTFEVAMNDVLPV